LSTAVTLVDEIITVASSEAASVSTLLRKCLVLAHTLRNDRLKTWAESELNGYQGEDESSFPDYRKTPAYAKGIFIGAGGAYFKDQPIPAEALRKQHRHWAETVLLGQPIAAYERAESHSSMIFPWPAGLTALYARTFFQGRYSLNRAWQEVPGSVIVGLIDTIKTRVLGFALELKDELGEVQDDPAELDRDTVDKTVINYIFGGTNVIASRDFVQVDNVEITQGDWSALSEALTHKLGVTPNAVTELKASLDDDAKEAPTPGLGTRTTNWLKAFGKKAGDAALNVGIEVAKQEATKWIHGYLGLPK
jgi:hypothetical protein